MRADERIDIRPRCITCGRPWFPKEGVDAQVTSCGNCPRSEVRDFAADMEERLRANDHKGGWTGEDYEYLVRRLKQETVELERALGLHCHACGQQRCKLIPPDDVIHEAADVANFAMMIADIARAQKARLEKLDGR